MKAEWQNELSLEIIMVVIEFDPFRAQFRGTSFNLLK